MSAVMAASCEIPASSECQCASIIPGISVRPPQSMTSASATASPGATSALMKRPSTSTSRPWTSRLPVPSKMAAFLSRIGFGGVCAKAGLTSPSAGAARLAAMLLRTERRDRPLSRRSNSPCASGLWQAHVRPCTRC